MFSSGAKLSWERMISSKRAAPIFSPAPFYHSLNPSVIGKIESPGGIETTWDPPRSIAAEFLGGRRERGRYPIEACSASIRTVKRTQCPD